MTELVATLSCGVFFGAALYVRLVQHPATLETGPDFASRFFAPMYRRAATLQVSAAVIGSLAGAIGLPAAPRRPALRMKRHPCRRRRSILPSMDGRR